MAMALWWQYFIVQKISAGPPCLPPRQSPGCKLPSFRQQRYLGIGEKLELTHQAFTPTVLTDVHRGMRLSCEEVFGPILPVFGFRTTEEAIASANDTSYGLAAYVLTRGLNTAIRMAEALEFGIVGINDMVPATAQCPFGGMKESGTGREGAHEGLEEYMESKYVSIAL